MKQSSKTESRSLFAVFIKDNEGSSIVLVTIIAILVITAVIILRTTTGSLWATADKQLYSDQAYEMATSLGDSLDVLILDQKVNLSDIYNTNGIIVAETQDTGLPNSTIVATVTLDSDGLYNVSVESHVASSSYIYTAVYRGSGTSYTRQY